MNNWIISTPLDVPEPLQTFVGGHPLVAQALLRRGITTPHQAEGFLNPDAYHATSPIELPDIHKAAIRLQQAIRQQERICVWGDFDVDGQTATTLLVSVLRSLGAIVTHYIPVRSRESHGIHIPRLQQILNGGAQLILTCDTGIAAVEAAEYLQSQHVDLLITDHHELPPSLPPAFSVTNPQLLPQGHPLRSLPGVGVAYKLAEYLLEQNDRGDEAAQLLDLVALGIVADVALLFGDTRYLLQRGLQLLRQPERLGLKAMFQASDLNPAHLTTEHIGFVLAPRLNALGRLADANTIVELLTTQDPARAEIMALELEGLNARRQTLTSQVFQAALAQLEREPAIDQQTVLILANPTWPAGILGIVASRLVDHFHRPTILISATPGQPGRGSARSVDGINITHAIASQKDLLLGYGGHAMAAGLSIDVANIPAFRIGLTREISRQVEDHPISSTLTIDGTLSLSDLNIELVEDFERLAPFGAGNPALVLVTPNLIIQAQRSIGKSKEHLLLTVQDDQEHLQEVIWWQGAGWSLPEGRFDLAYTLHTSNYRGQIALQVQWIEAQPHESGELTFQSNPAQIIIQDMRQAAFPQVLLEQLRNVPDVTVWSEADAKLKSHGVDRLELTRSRTLIIWTTPPGRPELQTALEIVKPEEIILFGIDPGMDLPDVFLERLLGLCKYSLNKQNGITEVARLATATAQSKLAVMAGLDFLQAKGMLTVHRLESDQIHLSAASLPSPSDIHQATSSLRAILQESAAYRAFFHRADPGTLIVS